jgi:hypothetical protein
MSADILSLDPSDERDGLVVASAHDVLADPTSSPEAVVLAQTLLRLQGARLAADALRSRLLAAETLLDECRVAMRRDGWEPGASENEVADKVDEYLSERAVEDAIDADAPGGEA